MKALFLFLFLILAGIFMMPSFSLAEDYSLEKIFYMSQKNVVDGTASLEKNWQEIDIVAPQMYLINSNLMINGGLTAELKEVIKKHDLKTMPLVINTNFNKNIIHNLLISEKDQKAIIEGLIFLAKKNNYIGWQFDFEHIDYKDRDLFSAFVEKTYEEFQKNNLILSVAVVARSVDFEDTLSFKSWSGVYDYERIANSSDFISLMTYDDPNSRGPVASKDFVNKSLAYVKDKIPAEKLSLGIPLYYWQWDLETPKMIGSGVYKSILSIMQNFKHIIGFDKELGSAWISYFYNNKKRAIWFENKQSFEQKLNIAKDNKLRGFSAWLLGGEDPGIWSILKHK